jgi:hypothetical protein
MADGRSQGPARSFVVRALRCALRGGAPLVGCALALAAAPAGADTPNETETLSPGDVVDLSPAMLTKAGLRVYAEESVSVLADFGAADASEFQTRLGLRVKAALSDSFALRFTAVGNASFFDFEGDQSGLEADLVGADLFDRLFDASFGIGGAKRLPWERELFGHKLRTSVFVEGRAKLAFEDGAPLKDAVKGTGSLGVAFELDPKLDLALGIDVGSRIDDGVSVGPIVSFRWQLNDEMRLETHGAGLLFAWDFCPGFELQLRGSYESDTYRLDERGPLLGNPTLRQREVPLLVALKWAPTERWRLAVGAGSVVYQQWRLEDEDEAMRGTVDAGPSALGWLRIEHRF